MSASDKPIQLTPELDSLLSQLYLRGNTPRDQYKQRPKESAELERRWHKLSGRDDDVDALVRYMKNQQKDKRGRARRGLAPWPVFNGTHKRKPEPVVVLNDEQLGFLRQIYGEIILPLGIGVDLVEIDTQLCSKLSKAFAKLAGMIVPGKVLVTIAEEKRKRGEWLTVGRSGIDRGIDFSDMDEIRDTEDGDGA